MSQPILEYYWVKVLADGKTIIPQFDFKTGRQNLWGSSQVQLSKILLLPFNEELANKVLSCGVGAISSNLPTHSVDIKPGDLDACAGITADISWTDYYECDVCGWTWQHNDGSKWAKCPQCGASDDWFCNRCNDYKDNVIRNKRGEVNCPDCDIPHGLIREQKLYKKYQINHTCTYFIKTSDFRYVVDENGNVSLGNLPDDNVELST